MRTEKKKTVDPVVGGSTVSETRKIMLSGNGDNKGKEKNLTQKTKQKKKKRSSTLKWPLMGEKQKIINGNNNNVL